MYFNNDVKVFTVFMGIKLVPSLSPSFLLVSDVFQEGIWKEVGSLKDRDLTSLADRLKSTVLMSRATGTVNGYTRAFNRWKVFASR